MCGCLSTCMSAPHASVRTEARRKHRIPLELELQTIVSCHLGAWNQTGILFRWAAPALNYWAISEALMHPHFLLLFLMVDFWKWTFTAKFSSFGPCRYAWRFLQLLDPKLEDSAYEKVFLANPQEELSTCTPHPWVCRHPYRGLKMLNASEMNTSFGGERENF